MPVVAVGAAVMTSRAMALVAVGMAVMTSRTPVLVAAEMAVMTSRTLVLVAVGMATAVGGVAVARGRIWGPNEEGHCNPPHLRAVSVHGQRL